MLRIKSEYTRAQAALGASYLLFVIALLVAAAAVWGYFFGLLDCQ